MKKILSIIIIGFLVCCSLGVQAAFFEKISDDCGCDKDMISILQHYILINSLIPEEELVSSINILFQPSSLNMIFHLISIGKIEMERILPRQQKTKVIVEVAGILQR
jgi:hypothetical protein